MKQLFLASLILCVLHTPLFAQDLTRSFRIEPSGHPVPNSLYSTIRFLDSRDDTSFIGTVQVGPLRNKPARLLFASPVQPSLTNLLNSLTDSTRANGELLFQLKDFSFVEPWGTRNFRVNAVLYAKEGDRYKPLSQMDTVGVIIGGDVLGVVTKAGNWLLSNFIAQALHQRPSDTVSYTIEEVAGIDSIEKRQIPLYNTPTYTNGLYSTYAAFKNQVPDKQGDVELHKDGSISVRETGPDGKKRKIKSRDIYAVVGEGLPFIATEYGFYPLQKLKDAFFFTGHVRVAASKGDLFTADLALGLTGLVLASRGNEVIYDMIIDYRNGRFIYLRVIPAPEETAVN